LLTKGFFTKFFILVGLKACQHIFELNTLQHFPNVEQKLFFQFGEVKGIYIECSIDHFFTTRSQRLPAHVCLSLSSDKYFAIRQWQAQFHLLQPLKFDLKKY